MILWKAEVQEEDSAQQGTHPLLEQEELASSDWIFLLVVRTSGVRKEVARAYDLAGDSERAGECRARAYAWYVKHDEQIEDPHLKRCFAALSFNRSLLAEVTS